MYIRTYGKSILQITMIEHEILKEVEKLELDAKLNKLQTETKGLFQEIEELKRQYAVLKKNKVNHSFLQCKIYKFIYNFHLIVQFN